MRIELKNSEKVAFVKAEAIAVLQNPDISSSLEPRNEITWYLSRTFAISELPSQRRLIIDEDNFLAAFSSLLRRMNARPPTADHSSVGVHPRVLILRLSGR